MSKTMHYSPATGKPINFELSIDQYRSRHPNTIWRYDPFTGQPIHEFHQSQDPHGNIREETHGRSFGHRLFTAVLHVVAGDR